MTAFLKLRLNWPLTLLLSALLAFEPVTYAQYEATTPPPPPGVPPGAPPQLQQAFTQAELDQMLAPIALYPDPLLSQILMASTYPLEVVEAARWSRANPGLQGDDAVRAIQDMDWDPSVKSLVAFPRILQMMDEKLDWTERLGDAFLAQQAQVTDTIQNLRQRAYAAGTLRSSDQIRVVQDGEYIDLEPVDPTVVYVPYYDPFVVYGSWWWPDYPPVYWGPWPGYYYQPAYAPGFAWSVGIILTTGFFFGAFDWHHHRAHVAHVDTYYYHRPGFHERPGVVARPGVWHHDPQHRHGVPYREPFLRQQFGRAGASPDRHRPFRGYEQPSAGGAAGHEIRPGTGGSQPVVRPRPTIQPAPSRPIPATPQARPITPAVPARPAPERRPPALEDIGRGSNVRDYSQRGRASQQGVERRQQSAPAPRPSAPRPQGGGRSRHNN